MSDTFTKDLGWHSTPQAGSVKKTRGSGFKRVAPNWLLSLALLLPWACTPMPEQQVDSRRIVVERLIQPPLDGGEVQAAVEPEFERPTHLQVGTLGYPALTFIGGTSRIEWPVDHPRAEYLTLGYYAASTGGVADLEFTVSLITDSGAQELFRDRVPKGGFRQGIRTAHVALPQGRTEGEIVFSSGPASKSGDQQNLRTSWINPRLVGRPEGRNQESRRKNILLICVDALRADRLTVPEGAESPMPRIEKRIRRSGALFSRAYSNAPWSLPSMASLLTGRFPGYHHAGLKTPLGEGDVQMNFNPQETQGGIELVIAGMRYRFQMLHDSIPTLQEVLGAEGYVTAAIHNNGYINFPTRVLKGMDHVNYYNELDASVGTDRALDWISRVQDQPFFLFLHYMDPHEWAQAATEKTPGLPVQPYDPDLRDVYMEAYDQLVAYTDIHLDRLLTALEMSGVLQDTYVVLIADHGEAFFEDRGYVGHGDARYELVLRVPLALMGPEIPATRIDARVNAVDVVPSLLELVGVDAEPYDLSGHSLLPLLRSQESRDRRVISEYALGRPELLVLYKDHWKMVFEPGPDRAWLYDPDASLPAEDVSEGYPEVARSLYSTIVRYRESAGRHFRQLRYGSTRIDDTTLESLRALGYID